MRDIRLMIAYPSREEVSVKFVDSLLKLYISVFGTKVPDEYDYNISEVRTTNHQGSILPQLRELIVDEALNANCTHLLFVDSDQTFPSDLAHYWLSKNLPVIAANIATKQIPSWPTARFKNPANEYGTPVYTDRKKAADGRIDRVWRVGTGVMLIDLSVFQKISRPFFPIRYNAEKKKYVGEDWCFCEKLEKAGIPIVVDHKMSYQIGHVGAMTYRHEMIEMQTAVNSLKEKSA